MQFFDTLTYERSSSQPDRHETRQQPLNDEVSHQNKAPVKSFILSGTGSPVETRFCLGSQPRTKITTKSISAQASNCFQSETDDQRDATAIIGIQEPCSQTKGNCFLQTAVSFQNKNVKKRTSTIIFKRTIVLLIIQMNQLFCVADDI